MSEIHADDYQALAEARVTQIEQTTVIPVTAAGHLAGLKTDWERRVTVTSSRASLTAEETRRVRLAVVRLTEITTEIITIKTIGVRP